jgi:hypothetical protein
MHEQLICEAIRSRRALRFLYEGEPRVLEPHTYGRDHLNDLLVYGWQLSGPGTPGWRSFRAANMREIALDGGAFEGTHLGYHRPSVMYQVLCESDGTGAIDAER